MAKKMTATEAAAKLTKAFKLDPPLPNRWSVIFRAAERLGHSARAMINADEGAFVQSEALGFSNGGYVKSYINDSGTLVKEREDGSLTKFGAAGNVVEFDAQGNVASNVYGGHTLGQDKKASVKQEELDQETLGALNQTFFNPTIKRGDRQLIPGRDGSGGSADFFGRDSTNVTKDAYDAKTSGGDGGEGILRGRGERVSQLVDQGAAVFFDPTSGTVKIQTPDGSVADLAYSAAQYAVGQGLVKGKPTFGAQEKTKEEDTTPAPTTPAPPVMSTPRQSAPAPDMPKAVSLEPSQAEIDRAAEVFVDDAVVLPTGSYDSPSIQLPTVEAPEGTTAVDAPTFEANVQRQAEQFKQRGIDQAQLIQPQTRAEKIAAGQTAGRLEQRLYQNRQGMSTYVLGVYNSEGVWTPSQPIPQGYRAANVGQVPYLVQQATSAPTTPNVDVTTNPFGVPADKVGDPEYVNVYQGGMIRGYSPGGMPQTDDFPLPNEEDETNPTVNVAGQQLDKGQVAQGQADLTAGAMLDPAGTVVAPPVATINPDAEGTVLGATTGQTATTAPIITDPAQVGQTITADTPDKPDVTKVTTQKAQTDVEDALKDVTGAKSEGPTKTIEAQTQDTTKVSDLEAAQGTTKEIQDQLKADMPTRQLSAEELVSGSAVDQTRVGETFGTGEVKAASMQDELTTLMDQFEGGNTPPWAAGAMRKATAVMAQRGLGASSMAGQAIIQAAMEASLPIAQIDTANKQQMALAKAEQRAKFMQIEFDQEFQSKVMNAAKVSEVANMNFTAEQQVALENAKMAQTMNLANLNNRQALVMAEAAQISQLEMASLNNRQQAQVQNAQNFLQIDMANLNNEQQAEIFKAQTVANTILSDTAASNASEQFNASSENQTEQFFASMKSQISQFNSAQTNAMSQFNAGEANAIQKFNSELQNQREVFNAQMYAQIAQANAKWRQDTTTINTASANQSNFEFAKNVNGLTNKSIDQIWQRERDLMSFAMQSSEAAMDRSLQIILGDKDLERVRMELDARESEAKGSLFTRFLFGSGVKGGFGGILKNIF
jgi:hypothetical protein